MVAPGGVGACVVAWGRAWLLPGGMRSCSRGACVVAHGGHAWLLTGGVCVVAPGGGGMHGCSWGGMHGCSWGGMRGCSWGGACVVFSMRYGQ